MKSDLHQNLSGASVYEDLGNDQRMELKFQNHAKCEIS